MNNKELNQQERDKDLKSQLSDEKVKIIERYRLTSTEDFEWISKKENSHQHTIFTHEFALNNDIIALIFRINYLCFAKANYYRENIEKFQPVKHNPEKGIINTELWDSDFLKHIASGRIIDYRFLQRITDIKIFKKFCSELDKLGDKSGQFGFF